MQRKVSTCDHRWPVAPLSMCTKHVEIIILEVVNGLTRRHLTKIVQWPYHPVQPPHFILGGRAKRLYGNLYMSKCAIGGFPRALYLAAASSCSTESPRQGLGFHLDQYHQ